VDELRRNNDLCKNVYDHILVDEYQDISAQRYKLIKELLDQNPKCKLFCVGDDWQSIMGFAGSNLEFFVNFEDYFDHPEITKISTNYRSIKTIVDAGACLIKNNYSCQLQKSTLSNMKKEEIIKVIRSPHEINYKWNYYRDIARDCLDRITEYLKHNYDPKDILILSRLMQVHTHQMPKLHYIMDNLLKGAEQRGIKISRNAKTTRNIRLLTVHKAKGLEAKVVFILNVIKDTYGFPCEIEDPAILEPARENYPLQDQKEEERRLFYVAMTRAMEDLYIYTWEPAMSEFLEEIADYTVEERLSY
jgi:DNA helicase-4